MSRRIYSVAFACVLLLAGTAAAQEIDPGLLAGMKARSIGAVSIFQPNPDIVWVGTGEGNPRNSASGGDRIYHSLDAGRAWKHLGLEDPERIHRILLHPAAVRHAL